MYTVYVWWFNCIFVTLATLHSLVHFKYLKSQLKMHLNNINQTHTAYMSIIQTSQRTDIVRWNIIVPETVWEERRSREDNWLYSAGWLIRVIKRTRRRLYCNHIDIGTIKFYIIMTGPSLLLNQGLSCELYSYLILLYLIWRGGACFNPRVHDNRHWF